MSVPEDKKLDQQLDEQKQMYDDMPKISSSKKIMRFIEAEENKKRRKGRWLRTVLPYTAGAAALFLVAALVLSQLQMNSGLNSSSIGESGADQAAEDSASSNKEAELHTDNANTDNGSNTKQQKEPSASDQVPNNINDVREKAQGMDQNGASDKAIDKWFLQVLKSRRDLANQEKVYLKQFTYHADEVNDVLNHPEDLESGELKTFVEKMKQQGLAFDSREGMLELKIPYGKYEEWFASHLSDKMNAYLDLKTNQVVLRDGSFAGSWNSVGESLVQTEKFLKQWPDFALADQVKQYYMKTFHLYFFGIASTPMSDPQTTIVKDEVKASYEQLMDTYPNTKTASIVQKYYKKLKKNDFRVISERSFFMPPLSEELVNSYTLSAEDLLSLSDERVNTYQKLKTANKSEKEAAVYGSLNPEDLLSMYFHSVSQGDRKTEYWFYMDGINDLPSRDSYVNKEFRDIESWVKKVKDKLVKVQFLVEGDDTYAKLYISGELAPHMVHLIKNSSNQWKVVWNPAETLAWNLTK